ncbi:hypothetical protein J437_LFUL008399 [Ladona fulva]|uniref:CARD domain-containing protein n=1 Tax=Ladona fulva TaxID=123851 RepID=A0A8K0NZJ8_LADFU|nr:hypothetical protein J437_LFUL008399 [Ladona fulva]
MVRIGCANFVDVNVMDVLQREALSRNGPAILADLDVEYVEDHLLSKGVLSVDDVDRLQNKFSTRKERATHLLRILPYRGPSAFDEFVESLREPYSWLAERLEKDIVEKPVSTGAEATKIGFVDAHKFEDNPDIIPNEICETITAVSTILSSLGTSICSLGDCLVDLANVFNTLNTIQKPQCLIQSNLVNGSTRGRKTGNVMRYTGGGDFGAQDKVTKNVGHEVNETEISLKKLSVTERRQVDLKCDGILDNIERVRHKNDKICGQENVNSEVSNPANVVPVVHNCISSSDMELTLKESYQTSEFANVTSKSLVSDLSSPSPETGLPVNSPDSGMFSEELSSHSLKSLCEANDIDEADGRKVSIPPSQDRSDGDMSNYTTSYCERNAQAVKDFTSCCKELRYKEQNLLHSLKDYVNAVRSVAAQITDRGPGLARVV